VGKSKKPKIPVTDYTMSVHAGICTGPVDALLGIYTGEKAAWIGEATGQGDIEINQLELYGGPKKEGGVQGVAHFMPGSPTQLMPENLAAKFGLTSATMPAYRGMASIFFHGGSDGQFDPAPGDIGPIGFGIFGLIGFIGRLGGAPNGVKGKPGFYWQSQNPNLKTIWARVLRRARGLTEGLALIPGGSIPVNVYNSNSDQELQTVQLFDANPAHIIYECLTNNDWGMGATSSMIDVPSFEACAQTLFDEGFGLSMMWVQQSKIEDFVAEVIDHIQATIYVNPRTGLITLFLIRDDQDVENAPLFTPDNCVVQKFARKGEGELINEITVTWTNPINEKDTSVTLQNLAGIVAAGGIVPDSRNYYGVRYIDLAMMLLNRDLRTASAPLAKCEMITNREGWDVTPGRVIRLTYPEHGAEEVPFRVGTINYGKPGDANIRVQLTEDIFSFDPGQYTIPNQTAWRDTSEQPAPIEFTRVVTLPYYISNQISDDTDEYPNVLAAALGAQSGTDTYGFDLLGEITLSDGSLSFELDGLKSLMSRGVLTVDLAAEALSNFDPPTMTQGPNTNTLIAGGFIIFGSGDETVDEWAYVERADSNSGGVFNLKRGVLDTTPKEWPAGTEFWFIDQSAVFYTDFPFAAGSTVNFKMLTRTSLGRLNEDDAEIVSGTLTERPHMPLRPANVSINGTFFADDDAPLNAIGDPFLTVAWANRNRFSEDSTVLGWSDGSVDLPAQTTVTVTVFSLAGDLWFQANGIDDVTYELDALEFDGPVGRVRVTTKDADLDDLESLQGHEITVRVRAGGYGFDYGSNYGGV